VETILELGRKAHQESRYAKYPFDGSKCLMILNSCLTLDETFCIVLEHEDQIVGFAAGYLVEHFFTSQRFANDMLVYVAPEYRSKSGGSILIKAFEDHVRENFGDIPIVMGITTGVEPERSASLYEFMGFKQCGTLFTKE